MGRSSEKVPWGCNPMVFWLDESRSKNRVGDRDRAGFCDDNQHGCRSGDSQSELATRGPSWYCTQSMGRCRGRVWASYVMTLTSRIHENHRVYYVRRVTWMRIPVRACIFRSGGWETSAEK